MDSDTKEVILNTISSSEEVSSVEADHATEGKLLRKVDVAIVPIVALLYLFCFIDRVNIGNARIAGLERDLKLRGYDFNVLLSVYFISYALCEIPSNLLCKLIGPGWYLPGLTIGFGIITLCNAFVKTFEQAIAVRFLLGIFEAGMLPGIAYYLSRWYKRDELAFRLALYIVTAPLAGAFGGLLASGILRLPPIGAINSWRLIFLIEGLITTGLGLVALVLLTDRPDTARWLTAAEKSLLTSRLAAERHTAVLDKFSSRRAWTGITSPITITTASIFFLNNLPVQGISTFSPTIVRTIFPTSSIINQQLLTVPPYVLGALGVLIIPYLSWRYDRRVIFLILCAPLLVIGFAMFLATRDARVRYAAIFFMTSTAFCYGALVNAHVSANVVSDSARSAAIGTVVMMGSLGGLVSMWSFLPFDAPDYRIGNGLNLGAAGTVVVLAWGMGVWMRRDNRRREEEGSGMEERQMQQDGEERDWEDVRFRWHE
ncbi:MFS-type transporter-like protein 77 [Elsinoe fawcettii]|nr:MFS-type transporter-like protein 77 [Elsinoe fawcettii]